MEYAAGGANWGSVPDWIAGVGSMLAFGGLAFGLWYEIRRARLERQDQQARHARLVYVSSVETRDDRHIVTVTNVGSEPVFDLMALPLNSDAMRPLSTLKKSWWRAWLGHGGWPPDLGTNLFGDAFFEFFFLHVQTLVTGSVTRRRRSLGPGGSIDISWPRMDGFHTATDGGPTDKRLPVLVGSALPDLQEIEIRFTDNNGLRWARTLRQQPRRVWVSEIRRSQQFQLRIWLMGERWRSRREQIRTFLSRMDWRNDDVR
ncbi:hypothetical protein BDK92_1282 [Micromonospora pisi]|uniref:Uncharacterized protein n=1 Tax=Micromonospora pisi TaxID=589240 RepID=A0A495JDB6_9ACTN|nr:hypothetical protein [Micromonospora pisi]RKR87010.1 hypothetical protein BDK92_1282 [Micromonospora pisi]